MSEQLIYRREEQLKNWQKWYQYGLILLLQVLRYCTLGKLEQEQHLYPKVQQYSALFQSLCFQRHRRQQLV